jgi:hypothetical protein
LAVVELHQPARGLLEASRGAQHQAALEAGGGHGHLPAGALLTEAVLHRHPDVVEEDLGEGRAGRRAAGIGRTVTPSAFSGTRMKVRPRWRSEAGSVRNMPKHQSAHTARVDQVFWPLIT